jgi:uncharacterized protein (DUF433 family)
MAKAKEPAIEIRKGAAGIDTAYVGRSRIRVADIARQYVLAQEELITERLHEWLPTLTLEQIRAAIDYWREHKDEIETYMAEEDAILAKIPYPG